MRTIDSLQINEGVLFQTFDNLVLTKGEEADGKWIIYLKASNESLDQDGEVVVMKAMKAATEDYLKYGVVSWDHQHRAKGDPESIIGEPLDVSFSANKETLVKAFLYQKNDKARSVWNNVCSGTTRLGASIGGAILNKAKNLINAVIWRDVAITDKPVNNGTFGKVQLLPFTEFAKALMAGSGVDAGAFTGGRALIPESLQGNVVKQRIVDIGELNELFKSLMNAMLKGRITDYDDLTNFVLDRGYSTSVARRIIKHVASNFRL